MLLSTALIFVSAKSEPPTTYNLTVIVNDLRNSTGEVQFSLYNKDGSIPDEHFENYYLQKKRGITNGSARVTFLNLPKGTYAINILHDENKNGIIEKGWVMPIEGIGFSNFYKIGFSNRPNFTKASFNLEKHTTKTIKVIYM